MTTTRTAFAALARTAIEAARAVGVDVDSVLGHAQLEVDQNEEADGRIAVTDLLHIWELLADASKDPYFGLHVGERFVTAKTVHVVGYAARNSRTLGDCYGKTVRFGRLTNEGSEIVLLTQGDRAIMRVGPLPDLPMWPRCYAEMALSAYLTTGRKWTGVDIQPVGATFQHPAPSDTSEYVRVFGENVEFDAEKNDLILRASALSLPFYEPDPTLGAYLEARAAVLLEQLDSSKSFESQVRSKIDEALADGTPSLALVADELGMSARTLQRRLGEKNLSFGQLVDDVRRRTALGLIGQSQFSVFEVAALTGYQDAPSFRAAFIRWTGMTPRDYRRSLRDDLDSKDE
jgi:AraC-like DNA-binding protein